MLFHDGINQILVGINRSPMVVLVQFNGKLERRTNFLSKTRLLQCRNPNGFGFCYIIFIFVSIANVDCRNNEHV